MKTLIFILFPIILFAQQYGSWYETDSLNELRWEHAIVLLENGNALVSGNGVDSASASCEIYDINNNKWTNTTQMNVPRYSHKMVLLNTGKVLAIGGGEKSCEIFNPDMEKWEITDSINVIRDGGYSVIKIKDGKIMVLGGYKLLFNGDPILIYNENDIYDPVTRKWTIAAPMLKPRMDFAATLLNNGNILVSGGFNHGDKYLKECEIYLTDSNTWVETDSLIEARSAHSQILLDDGNVLLVGGTSRDSNGNAIPENHCLLYNVQTSKWETVGKIAAYRNSPGVFKLDANKIIILGGDDGNTWEIYSTEKYKSIYINPFPITLIINSNNTIQFKNNNIFVAGGTEFTTTGFPVLSPSKKCFQFDITTAIEEKSTELIESFKLFQNYPNPFNPSTQINFSIIYSSKVSLKIYDILGREIKTLLNKKLNPGRYSITWDGTDNSGNKVTSGMYIYRIKANNFVKSEKMILMK